MVLADIGADLKANQVELWQSLMEPHPDQFVLHAFLAYCLWLYPSFQDAVLKQGHHNAIGFSHFATKVLPVLFNDFFDGKHEQHTVESFVRDTRAEYIFTVGVIHKEAGK